MKRHNVADYLENDVSPNIMATKLIIPPVTKGYLIRQHLNTRIIDGLKRKLTLISASAGSGKTSLLSDCLVRNSVPCAWYSLDRSDNVPERFWRYLYAALKKFLPNNNDSKSKARDIFNPSAFQDEFTVLINALTDSYVPANKPNVLVLDNFEVIQDKDVYNGLIFLLDNQPPGLHIVISSRQEPHLPIARYRAQSSLNEIRNDDLKLSRRETLCLINSGVTTQMPQSDIDILDRKTEGWITGLIIATEAIKEQKARSGFIRGFDGNNRHISDYLNEEAFSKLSDEDRKFLLSISVLNRLSGPLCNAVTGRQDGQQMLEKLEAANLFILSLDCRKKWYRFHSLFLDYLRGQLHNNYPGLIRELHIRASKWHCDEHLIDEAIHHAFEAQDLQLVIGLLESSCMTMLMQGRWSTLLGWLEKIPDQVIISHPYLCVTAALTHQLARRLGSAEYYLEAAERTAASNFFQDAEEDGAITRVRGCRLASQALSAITLGELEQAKDLCHNAIESMPQEVFGIRAMITALLARIYWGTGDLITARHYLERIQNPINTWESRYVSLLAMSRLAEILREQGYLSQAAYIYRQAIELGQNWGNGHPLPITSYAYIGLSQILFEWNELDAAMEHIMEGLELAEQCRLSVTGYITLARLYQARNDYQAAIEWLHSLDTIPVQSRTQWWKNYAAAWRARIDLAVGNLNACAKWASTIPAQSGINQIPDFLNEVSYFALVRFYIANNSAEVVLDPLEDLLSKVEKEGRTSTAIEIHILRSLAFQSLEQTEEAIAVLYQALSLAESRRYVRIFLDEGEPMIRLLRLAWSRNVSRKYVRLLLSEFSRYNPNYVAPEKMTTQESEEVSPLSNLLHRRELDVLKLIVAGKTNQEIGGRLFISKSTVKTHINNIYGKLGIQSRIQAVNLARQMNIFNELLHP